MPCWPCGCQLLSQGKREQVDKRGLLYGETTPSGVARITGRPPLQPREGKAVKKHRLFRLSIVRPSQYSMLISEMLICNVCQVSRNILQCFFPVDWVGYSNLYLTKLTVTCEPKDSILQKRFMIFSAHQTSVNSINSALIDLFGHFETVQIKKTQLWYIDTL